MRALITGIQGFAGSHLAEYLLADGRWEVFGQSRQVQAHPSTAAGGISIYQCNLADRHAVHTMLAELRPAVIFHLAGQAFVPQSFSEPSETLAANTTPALNFCVAISEQKLATRLLVVGTNEQYGAIRPADLPLSEETPFRPTSPYGVSKATQDLLALQYFLSHEIATIRIRPFTHIGPRQNYRFVSAAFARQIARIEAGLQPPVIEVGNLSACRDFSDVRDMVRGYALLAEHGTPGEAYNLGRGQSIPVAALLEQLLSQSDVEVTVRQNPALMRPVDIPDIVCDSAKAFACTGWRAEIAMEQTLGDILADWRIRTANGE